MRRAVTLLVGVLISLLVALLAGSTAIAAETGQTISGTLIDQTNPKKPTPVEGVGISISTPDGGEVGSAQTDREGRFSIPVEGAGTYVVTIQEDTLPENTFLRNPDQQSLEVTLAQGESRTVIFPLGPDTREVESSAERAPELLVNGLLFGLMIALASLGLSLIFGTTGLTNFAHGELVTFGAIVAWAFNVALGMPLILAAVLAVVVAGVFGWAQDSFFWRPLRRRGTGLIAMMIVSIGLAIFLRSLYQYFFGGGTRTYSSYVAQSGLQFGPVSVTPRDLFVMAIALLVLVGVTLALQRTRLGKATRAVADNPPLASASGINVDRVISVVWIGGAALAGLAGILLGITQQIEYQLGFKILLLVFAAVTLGGLGTIWGALVGSLIVGVFIEVSTLVVPAELKNVGALAVLILILLVRPQGILGRRERVG